MRPPPGRGIPRESTERTARSTSGAARASRTAFQSSSSMSKRRCSKDWRVWASAELSTASAFRFAAAPRVGAGLAAGGSGLGSKLRRPAKASWIPRLDLGDHGGVEVEDRTDSGPGLLPAPVGERGVGQVVVAGGLEAGGRGALEGTPHVLGPQLREGLHPEAGGDQEASEDGHHAEQGQRGQGAPEGGSPPALRVVVQEAGNPRVRGRRGTSGASPPGSQWRASGQRTCVRRWAVALLGAQRFLGVDARGAVRGEERSRHGDSGEHRRRGQRGGWIRWRDAVEEPLQ